MKTKQLMFVLVLLLCGTMTSWAGFKDFSVQVNNQGGTLLTSEEIATQGTAFEFGVAVAADGTVSRVAADDASSVATVSGNYHSDHGATGLKVVVPVDGTVKITVGQCTYSGNAIKVTNSAGTEVVTKTPAKACWKNDHANITELYYTGEATTLTISGMGYCPYVAVEKSEAVINKYNIAYSLGTENDVTGNVPATVTWTEGDTYAIPANYTLYKEGYTLTGWNDGASTVAIGAEYTPTTDVTMTPVFTHNTVSLADRKEPVTLKWNFRRDQGAPTVGWEGKPAQPWVTQATINGETIDVKMDVTTSPGKFNNGSNIDWAQCNNGTTFTLPNAKGAVVSMEAYNDITTTTIDGQSDYTHGKTITYNVMNTAETVDVVIGDGSYYRYVQVVLPVQQTAGGKTYTDESGSITWALGNEEKPYIEENISGAISNTTVSTGADLTVETATYFEKAMMKYTPRNSNAGNVEGVMIEYRVKPAKGVTFKPTKVTYDAVKVGTDGATFSYDCVLNGVSQGGKDVDASTVLRNNGANAATAQLGHTVDINAEAAGEFAFRFYISKTANNKNIAIGNVAISGIFNGTTEEVTMYSFSTKATPENGGNIIVYPKANEYEDGSEVTLTATPNFGYHFVNWTDAEGKEISTEAKFKYTVTANAELTANFKKVNTYELAYNVEGGANLYQVQPTPVPTVIDGKNMYEEGTKVTLTASSNPIMTFTNWSNGETASEIVITMDDDKNLTASYSAADFIAAWDFYRRGGDGRAADFAAADNDAASLVMRNAEGTTSGWLDKSQEAADGYEGRAAAVNWRTTGLGEYYWQTTVNAAAFTDIKVKSAMLYNYNAYTKYNVEYSLDGETWTGIGSHVMEGTKNWNDGEFAMPADANNKEKVYIRWIADKESKVDGTQSNNDGIAISGIYITGKAQLIDDGTAPVLVSSVPENNGTGASANGKIVLTFDEKVKLTDAAKATLGTQNLVPTVSGKTVICEYKGLDYSTNYTFTLVGNSVADLTDNAIKEDIVISFQTKVKPVIEKKLYDFIVGTDGTITEALAAANARGASATERYRIFIANGNHVFDTNGTTTGGDGKTYDDPRSYLTAPYVSFIGESMEGVTITNKTPDATWDNGHGKACPLEGIGNGDVLIIQKGGHDAYFQNLTMKSSMGDAHGRDIVLNDQSNRTIFKDACLWGYQDTYVSNSDKGKFYFEGGVIRGRTDFLCGKGDVYYNEVTLQQCGTGGYLAVPSVAKKYGYVFNNCYIKKETDDVTFYLGRPWGSGTPVACFINTKMDANAMGNGWADMSGGWPKRFAEYNSYLTSGTQIDLSGRRTSWTDKEGKEHANDPILTVEDVNAMSLANVMGQDDDWDPTALTEQASAPTNVKYTETTLTWDDNNYVLGWVVFKNGKFAANVIEPTYTIDDTTAEWSVRAANEMGGLGEATVAQEATGIEEIENAASADDKIYNLAGQRLKKAGKGINIIGGKKVIVK